MVTIRSPSGINDDKEFQHGGLAGARTARDHDVQLGLTHARRIAMPGVKAPFLINSSGVNAGNLRILIQTPVNASGE